MDRAITLDPKVSEYWVAKTNLLLARGAVQEAFRAVEQAAQTADAAQKATVCRGEAARFYQARAHDAAVQLYRVALQSNADTGTATSLAWILATSPSDAVRNGEEALRLTTQVVAMKRDATALTAHAAALAETKRFEEAVQVATELVAMYREQKDASGTSLAEARLAKYRAGQPLRE